MHQQGEAVLLMIGMLRTEEAMVVSAKSAEDTILVAAVVMAPVIEAMGHPSEAMDPRLIEAMGPHRSVRGLLDMDPPPIGHTQRGLTLLEVC